MQDGISKKDANKIFDSLTVYSFNKGHATGYAIIAMQQMWYKAHFPEEFWYVTMKYCNDDKGQIRANAVLGGSIILLPHVNGEAYTSLTTYDGSRVIQEGTLTIKNVGEKAALEIQEEKERNGEYKSRDDFLYRINRSVVNKRVIDALTENGALEFDNKIFESRVEKYNSTMYMKAH
jgi:DNA polymerase-3 subunit alpha